MFQVKAIQLHYTCLIIMNKQLKTSVKTIHKNNNITTTPEASKQNLQKKKKKKTWDCLEH